MNEPVRRKKNRSYARYLDADTTIDYVVSYLGAPAPACAAWLSRRRLASGASVMRGRWFARQWTMGELQGVLPKLEKAGLPVDQLADLIREYEQDQQEATAMP